MADRLFRPVLVSLLTAVLATAGARTVAAQSPGACRTAHASVGATLGRTGQYIELDPAVAPSAQLGSILVEGGSFGVSGRGEIPIAGPWLARVEGSFTGWDVVRQVYSPDASAVVAREPLGRVHERHLVGMVGRQGGPKLCGRVLAGGGLYAISYAGTTVRRPGVALSAGIDVPAGPGAVQVDVQLHLIDTNSRYPLTMSTTLAYGLMAGWVYRF